MPQPSFLTRDQVQVGADLGFRTQLDDALSEIRMPQMLDDATSRLRQMAEAPSASSQMPMSFGGGESFKVDDLTQTMPGYGVEPEPVAPPSTGMAAPTMGMRQPAAAASSGGPSDFNAYVRQGSAQRGMDSDQVAAVMGREGPEGWSAVGRFDTGESYGPLQLHYAGGSNPKRGMGDDFTRDTGIDLRTVDPNTPEGIAAHQRAVDYALDRLSKTGDYREWYGADPALGSRHTPVKRVAPVAPQPMSAQQQGGGEVTPDQFKMSRGEGLDEATAEAVCGPAAAIAFARANGRNPSMREAVDLARQVGWTPQQGMAGPSSQVQLLKRMGIAATMTEGEPDWQKVRADAQRGNPVTLSSRGHYFVVERVDPDTGMLDLGNSALVLKASGGRRWFRPEEIASLGMGPITAAIYKDSPSSPSPSVVAGRSGY